VHPSDKRKDGGGGGVDGTQRRLLRLRDGTPLDRRAVVGCSPLASTPIPRIEVILQGVHSRIEPAASSKVRIGPRSFLE